MHPMAPPTVPSGCPAAFVAGDTVVFDDGPFSHPTQGTFGSDLYTPGYEFRNSHGHRETATYATQGSGWRFTLSATQTLALKEADVAGAETLTIVITATLSSERYTVGQGSVVIWPDPVTGQAWASNDEEMLALVRTAIRSLLTSNVTSYSVAGRSFTKTDVPALMAIEGRLVARIEMARAGGQFGRAIEVQFR